MISFLEKWREKFRKRKAISAHTKLSDLNKKLVFSQTKRKIPSFSQLRYIFVMFSRRDLFILRTALLVFLISLLGFGARMYFRSTQTVPVSGGEYIEGVVGIPQYINPLLSQASDVDSDLSRLIFSGLFRYNDQQELVPDLVTSYALSEDQKTYTFYLRQDVRFHDGEPFRADDVVFTLTSIQDPQFKSPLAPSMKGVVVTKIDDYTVSLTLKEPFAPFLSGLTFGILPQHLWTDIPAENSTLAGLNVEPIGTGPFRYTSLVKDKSGDIQSYVLKRNTFYYGEKPYLDKVTFMFFNDIASAVAAARAKDIQGIAFISHDDRQFLENKNKNLAFYSLRLPQYTAVFFNQNNKVLADMGVRQALAWSFDREKVLSEALRGDGQIIYSPILPGYLGNNPEIFKYGFDVEKAKQILEAAGWKVPADGGLRRKGDVELAFTITTVDQPEYLTTLDILKTSWEALGARVETKIVSSAEAKTSIIKPRDYEALLFGEIIGIDPDPYPFWHSTQTKHPGLNLAISSDEDVDRLLEEARQTNDLEQRRVKYLNFQNILAEKVPAIFLYNPLYTYAITKDMKGVSSTYITVPSDRFDRIHEWYIKTKRIFR